MRRATWQTSLQNSQLKKTDLEEYDLVILGGGTGSTIAAWTFAKQGQSVAAIDRKYIGESCHQHSLPSQQEHYSQCEGRIVPSEKRRVWHSKRDFTVDMSVVRDRKRRMVSGWNNAYLDNYKKTGAEFILGTGRLQARLTNTVRSVLDQASDGIRSPLI